MLHVNKRINNAFFQICLFYSGDKGFLALYLIQFSHPKFLSSHQISKPWISSSEKRLLTTVGKNTAYLALFSTLACFFTDGYDTWAETYAYKKLILHFLGNLFPGKRDCFNCPNSSTEGFGILEH